MLFQSFVGLRAYNLTTVMYWFLFSHAALVLCLLPYTVALHLSGLSGTARHPAMWKIRIIGVLFKNRLQFEVEKNSTNSCFGLHIYLPTDKTLIHNSVFVFDS